jgi:hypothetical protein
MKLLLLLFTALKFGKLLPAVLTMAISVGVYAMMFGWWYAAGFVALIATTRWATTLPPGVVA